MIMLCWFYCIPFAKLLYFAIGPLLLIFSLFVLKRGIKSARSGLRQTSFFLMFFAFFKMCIFDVPMLKQYFLCDALGEKVREAACSTMGMKLADIGGLVLLPIISFLLFHYYRIYMNIKVAELKTPEQVNLRFWANLTFIMIMTMVFWQLAPWAGYLTIGRTPALFVNIPWQWLAMTNVALLLIGFWKAESCPWVRSGESGRKNREKYVHLNQTWTPRDTLWVSTFIFLVTLALSYVSHDVLARGMGDAATSVEQLTQ